MSERIAQKENSNAEKVKKGLNCLSDRKYEIAYRSVCVFLYIHTAACYGLYLALTEAKWISILFTYCTFLLSAIGIVVGGHKLWAHRSFKAKLPLEMFLLFCHSMAFQFSVYNWVRDHRMHHKHSDTDADPHNSSRGFFFSHMGWLMVRRHPEVMRLGSTINMEDIRSNRLLAFQKRNAIWLLPAIAFILPTLIPAFSWNEDLSTSWHLNQLRFLINLHLTFTVNSVSHMWGHKPYDCNLRACQSLPVVLLTFGEGFHNYHHAFPFDYKSAERRNCKVNFMAMFVDLCAKLGQAYDLREASEELVRRRQAKTGDGSDLWCRRQE